MRYFLLLLLIFRIDCATAQGFESVVILANGDTLKGFINQIKDPYEEFTFINKSNESQVITPEEAISVQFDQDIFYSKKYSGDTYFFKAVVVSNLISLYCANKRTDFYLEKDTLSLIPKPVSKMDEDGKMYLVPKHLSYLSFMFSDCNIPLINEKVDYNQKDLGRVVSQYVKCKGENVALSDGKANKTKATPLIIGGLVLIALLLVL